MLISAGVGPLNLPVHPRSARHRSTATAAGARRGKASPAVPSSALRASAVRSLEQGGPISHVVSIFEAKSAKGPLEIGIALCSCRHPSLIRVAQFEDTVDYHQTCSFLEAFPPSQVVLAKTSEGGHLMHTTRAYLTGGEDAGIQLIAGTMKNHHSKRM